VEKLKGLGDYPKRWRKDNPSIHLSLEKLDMHKAFISNISVKKTVHKKINLKYTK